MWESGCRRDGMITPDILHIIQAFVQTDRVRCRRKTAPHSAGSGRRGGGGRMMHAYTLDNTGLRVRCRAKVERGLRRKKTGTGFSCTVDGGP